MKTLHSFIILFSCCLAFVSCSGAGDNNGKGGASKVSSKELLKNGDYRTACANGDWSTAYNIVGKLKDEANDYKAKNANIMFLDNCAEEAKNLRDKYTEAEHYVVLQQCMTLIDEGDEGSMMRIAVIVNEHKAEWVYDELEKIAKQMGNDELYETLSKMDNKEERIARLKKEIMNEKFPSRPALGMQKIYSDVPQEYHAYNEAVEQRNAKCMSIIQLAIAIHDKKAANVGLSLMKESLTFQKLEDNFKKISTDNSDIVQAKQLIKTEFE